MIFVRAKIPALLSFAILSALLLSCSSTADFASNVRRLQFKIDSISDFKIAGIEIEDIKSSDDLTDFEESKLSEAIAAKKLPSSFTINVLVRDPNYGMKNISSVLKELKWRLLIDGKETAKGNLGKEFEILGDTIIHLKAVLDLTGYGSQNVRQLIDSAFSLCELRTNVELKAIPVIETNFGMLITEEILINRNEFR